MKFTTGLIGSILIACSTASVASAQLFPKLPFEFPKPSDTGSKSTGTNKVLGAGAGCGVGGAAGYFGVKSLGGFLQEQGITSKEAKQAALIAGGVGCIIGGKVALEIIQNMDEKSKQAQENAWRVAQANTGNQPVRWQGPQGTSYSGTVEIEGASPLPDGRSCITRKDYVLASGEEATVYNRYCKNLAGEYEIFEA